MARIKLKPELDFVVQVSCQRQLRSERRGYFNGHANTVSLDPPNDNMLSVLVRIELPVEEQAPRPHAEPTITSLG